MTGPDIYTCRTGQAWSFLLLTPLLRCCLTLPYGRGAGGAVKLCSRDRHAGVSCLRKTMLHGRFVADTIHTPLAATPCRYRAAPTLTGRRIMTYSDIHWIMAGRITQVRDYCPTPYNLQSLALSCASLRKRTALNTSFIILRNTGRRSAARATRYAHLFSQHLSPANAHGRQSSVGRDTIVCCDNQ